jgi:hypothetical protein
LRLRLLESRLIRSRIDCEKQIPFLYISPVLKVACNDLSADLRLDLNCFVSSAGADFVEIKRHIFADHLRHQHRSNWWLRRFRSLNSALQCARDRERREGDEEENTPTRDSLLSVAGRFHSPRFLKFGCCSIS